MGCQYYRNTYGYLAYTKVHIPESEWRIQDHSGTINPRTGYLSTRLKCLGETAEAYGDTLDAKIQEVSTTPEMTGKTSNGDVVYDDKLHFLPSKLIISPRDAFGTKMYRQLEPGKRYIIEADSTLMDAPKHGGTGYTQSSGHWANQTDPILPSMWYGQDGTDDYTQYNTNNASCMQR